MEERSGTARRKTRTAPLFVLLILIAAAIGGAHFLGMTVDPASYVPKDAAMAVTVSITGSSDQRAAYDYINSVLKQSGVDASVTDTFKKLDKELGMDTRKFARTHLNGKAAAAVLSQMAGATPQTVIVIGTRTRNSAGSVMTVIGNQLNKRGVAFTRNTYGRVHYYSIPSPQVTTYVGAVKSTVVCANTEAGFKKAVDTANGKPSLADNKDYTSLRKTSPKTFATTYISGEKCYEMVGPSMMLAAGRVPGAADGIEKSLKSVPTMVGIADASADGITYTITGPRTGSKGTVKAVGLDKLTEDAPKDAALLIAIADVAGVWKQCEELVLANPAVKSQVDTLVAQVSMTTGLDIRKDIIGQIRSLQACYVPSRPTRLGAFPGEANLVLGVNKPDTIAQSLQTVHLLAALSGKAMFTTATFAGQDCFSAPIGPTGNVVTDAVIGNKVLLQFSGTPETMEAAVARAKTPGKGLSSSAEFKMVKAHLPADAQFLIYGNASTIIEAFSEVIPEKDTNRALTVTKKLGTFALAATQDDQFTKIKLAIPLAQ